MNKYRDEKGHWTTEENNNGPCYHYSDGPEENYERELGYDPKNCYQDAKKVFDKVKQEGNYGTFDFNGKEIVNRYNKSGFQVSFFRDELIDDKLLSEEEINKGIQIIIDYLDDLQYPDIGIFGNRPEISHYSINKYKADKIAKLFNQAEILSWKKTDSKDKYVIGDNAISNPYYEKERKLTREDYLKAFEELKNETRNRKI